MRYATALQLKEQQFPQRIHTYGTCPHVDDPEVPPGECGCDFMYKIVSNPNLNELIDACCPEFAYLSFSAAPDPKDNVWVVAGKIGRRNRTFTAQHADQALAEFWLAKHRYQTKTKKETTTTKGV